MAFDGIVMHSVVDELKEKLLNGRVDKIYQPEKDEILIHVRSQGENLSLLLSSSSSNPRIYLSQRPKKNPLEAPMFCMILRKHLLGASLINIEQFKTDRIIFIDMLSRDELGINREKRLVVEIMGRHSNIILIDKETGKVIDAINRVSLDMSSVRQVYPGSSYSLPPLQDKLNPLDLNREFFDRSLKESQGLAIFKYLYMNYLGLSPILSRQICIRAGLEPKLLTEDLDLASRDRLFNAFASFMDQVARQEYFPNMAYDDKNSILGFHIIKLDQFDQGQVKSFSSVSQLLDNYYYEKDLYDRIYQKSSSLRRLVNNSLDRAKNKLIKQEKELEEARDRDKYKVYGDLISANIHLIERGANQVELENFYDEKLKKVSISLDEKLAAHANAQKYYKKYSRLKNASLLLEEEIPNTRGEISYLENVVYALNSAQSTQDLDEVREELVQAGYIKQSSRNKKKKALESKPLHFVSSKGKSIYVGRNNRQNDQLSFKLSSRNDVWLHAQNIPGSHVIIKSSLEELDPDDLLEAASLAGHYSSGKDSASLAIDYTERKHVRKQKAARPGLVFYEDFSTILVDPNKNLPDLYKNKSQD